MQPPLPPTPPAPPPPGAGTLPLGEMSLGHANPGPVALRYEAKDGRPDTALGITWLTGAAVAGGALFTVAIPGTVLLAAFVLGLAGAVIVDVTGLDETDPEAELELEEEDIIEARFVRLGVDFDDQLPNRVVPVQATHVEQVAEVPTEHTPTRERRERPEEPPSPNSIQDLMQRLDDRAELFEELAERREVEGDPDGIEEGTETEAAPGDIYRGRLYSFFRRGWTRPITMSADDVAGLVVTAQVQIGQDLEIVSFSLRGTSGNALFDESVIQQLTRLQAAGQHIPPPPEEVAEQYIGQPIAVRFSGRQAR